MAQALQGWSKLYTILTLWFATAPVHINAQRIYQNAAENLSFNLPADFEELSPPLREMLTPPEPDGETIHARHLIAAFRRQGEQFPVLTVMRFAPSPSVDNAARMPNLRRSDGRMSEYFQSDFSTAVITPNQNNWYFDRTGKVLLCLSEMIHPSIPRGKVVNTIFMGKVWALEANWFVQSEQYINELPALAVIIESVKWKEPPGSNPFQLSPLDQRQREENGRGLILTLGAAGIIITLREVRRRRRLRRAATN